MVPPSCDISDFWMRGKQFGGKWCFAIARKILRRLGLQENFWGIWAEARKGADPHLTFAWRVKMHFKVAHNVSSVQPLFIVAIATQKMHASQNVSSFQTLSTASLKQPHNPPVTRFAWKFLFRWDILLVWWQFFVHISWRNLHESEPQTSLSSCCAQTSLSSYSAHRTAQTLPSSCNNAQFCIPCS